MSILKPARAIILAKLQRVKFNEYFLAIESDKNTRSKQQFARKSFRWNRSGKLFTTSFLL
jgi:hypothetical protein